MELFVVCTATAQPSHSILAEVLYIDFRLFAPASASCRRGFLESCCYCRLCHYQSICRSLLSNFASAARLVFTSWMSLVSRRTGRSALRKPLSIRHCESKIPKFRETVRLGEVQEIRSSNLFRVSRLTFHMHRLRQCLYSSWSPGQTFEAISHNLIDLSSSTSVSQNKHNERTCVTVLSAIALSDLLTDLLDTPPLCLLSYSVALQVH